MKSQLKQANKPHVDPVFLLWSEVLQNKPRRWEWLPRRNCSFLLCCMLILNVSNWSRFCNKFWLGAMILKVNVTHWWCFLWQHLHVIPAQPHPVFTLFTSMLYLNRFYSSGLHLNTSFVWQIAQTTQVLQYHGKVQCSSEHLVDTVFSYVFISTAKKQTFYGRIHVYVVSIMIKIKF